MRNLFAAAALAAAFSSLGAAAAPGPAILTAGGADAQSEMTSGLRVEDVKGVHLIRGRQHAAEADALLGAEPPCAAKEVDVVILDRPWRRFRRMRTQGFYSGVPYPSRPYTQGFYSGMR